MYRMGNGLAFQLCDGGIARRNIVTCSDGVLNTMTRYMGEMQHWDGVGFDVDTRCVGEFVFEGNYTYSCFSGAFGFFDYGETTEAHIKIENNISHNDHKFIYYQIDTSSYDFEIRNNLMIRDGGCQFANNRRIVDPFINVKPGALRFENNTFCYHGPVVEPEQESCTYSGNRYCGRIVIPDDKTAKVKELEIKLPTRETAVNMTAEKLKGYYAVTEL